VTSGESTHVGHAGHRDLGVGVAAPAGTHRHPEFAGHLARGVGQDEQAAVAHPGVERVGVGVPRLRDEYPADGPLGPPARPGDGVAEVVEQQVRGAKSVVAGVVAVRALLGRCRAADELRERDQRQERRGGHCPPEFRRGRGLFGHAPNPS
jgi:hypothetical protein